MRQFRFVLLYASLLVLGAFVLQLLEYRYLARSLSGSAFAGIVAVIFAAVGIFVGVNLVRSSREPTFERNEQGLKSLGITEREYSVLEALATGATNKEIARSLSVSPNTVKTHIAHLYDKLGVSRRTAAVQQARALRLIP